MASIVIVDDVPAHRALLIGMLSEQQHRVIEASNGAEALAAIASDPPDLVITDVLMPVMDGYELVRHLRADAGTRDIPVLFYSAPYGVREARAFARESGVPYVLTKPPTPDEVIGIVNRILAGESDLEPAELEEDDREYLNLLTYAVSETDEELRLANRRLRALINIGLDVTGERDPAKLIEQLCTASHDLFGASYVTMGFISPDDGSLISVSNCGLPEASWSAECDCAPGILGEVVAARRVRRGTNPGGAPAALGLPTGHPPIHAYVAAPIGSRRGVYGWICLVKNDDAEFSDLDEQLVMALAAQAGRVLGIDHEIAERRAAEAALRAERDRGQLYLDTADVVLLALDAQGRVIMINRAGCDLLGWTESELLGRDWIESIVPASERDVVRQNVARALAGRLASAENGIVARSGDVRRIEWRNVTPLRGDDGECIGVFCSGTDVTQRNEAAEELRTLQERKGFALESANIGVWDSDVLTGELRWSEITEAQYGLAPGTFPGTFEAFAARIHADDRDAVLAEIALNMTHGGDFQVAHRIVRPDGEVRWINGAGRVILDAGGQPVRAIGVSMDVTERTLLEAQFQQAQKMEAVGRLAGGVAHDFNNVLTAILGYCDLLLTDLEKADTHRADVEEIKAAGMSAAALTRQLLAFSRKEIAVPTMVDLNEVVAGMSPMVKQLIGEDVEIVMELEAGLSPVRADRSQIEQVLLNLCVNSRDAMPEGGTIAIVTTGIEFDEASTRTQSTIARGAYAALTVSDTGSGMTTEVQSHMFEPFYTTKEAGRGTGLGLSTVHGIALQSGGGVQVESKPGSGTSITVYLPRVDGVHVPARAPIDVQAVDQASHTILVVEDAESVRDLTRRLLRRSGYNVLVAADAEAAMQLIDEDPSIDVLLTDVVMPGTSGPGLMRRALDKRPDLRVIFMSGYTDDAIVHRGAFENDIAFLPKPFTSETLNRKVQDVLAA